MTAAKRTTACEGACGCRIMTLLDADENGEPWETAAVPELPGALEAVAAHTPARCRAIRALREAGERAAGEGGCAFVLALPPDVAPFGPWFLVRCWTADERWAEHVASSYSALNKVDLIELDLLRALDRPALTTPYDAPIIARDPHLGRSRSEGRS